MMLVIIAGFAVFLFSCRCFMFDFAVGVVSVLDLYLVSSNWELVQLVYQVVLQCNVIVCF